MNNNSIVYSQLVSLAQGVNWTDPEASQQKDLPLGEVYDLIRSPRSEDLDRIKKLRQLVEKRQTTSDVEEAGRLKAQIAECKKNLPMFTPSGSFSMGNRRFAELRSYSSRIIADIDFEDNKHRLMDRFEEVKADLSQDPFLESVFDSPSGNGLKAIVKVDTGPEEHRLAFEAVKQYLNENYDLNLDKSGSDLARGCFLSYDPEIRVKEASTLDVHAWQPPKKQKGRLTFRERSVGPKMGFSEEQCQRILQFISPEERDTWIRVGFALKHQFGDGGYQIWSDWSAGSLKWNEVEDPFRVWNGFDPHSITMGSLIYLTKLGGWIPSAEDWTFDIRELTHELPKIPRRLFNPLLEEYLELLAENQNNLPYEVAVCCFLGVLSFAIGGNKILQVRGKWTAKGQLWLALVGRPGSGKTHIIDAVGMDFLHATEELEKRVARQEYDEACSNSDNEDSPSEPEETRRLTADSITLEALFRQHAKAINQAGFGIHADEILAVVNGMDQYKGKGNDKQIWLKLFNHSSAEMTTVNDNRKIDSAFVPLLGGIQPDMLGQLIGCEKQGDGFAARFLMCHGERGEVLSVERRKELGKLLDVHGGAQQLEGLLENLLQIRGQQTAVEMTDEAQDHLLHYMKYLDDLASIAEPAQEFAYSKLSTYTYRVALLLHYCFELLKEGRDPDRLDTKLGLETAQCTTLIMEYFRESMLYSYGIVQQPKEVKVRQKILAKVQEFGKKATREKVKQSFRNSFTELGVSKGDGYRYAGELIKELCDSHHLVEITTDDGKPPYLKVNTEVQK